MHILEGQTCVFDKKNLLLYVEKQTIATLLGLFVSACLHEMFLFALLLSLLLVTQETCSIFASRRRTGKSDQDEAVVEIVNLLLDTINDEESKNPFVQNPFALIQIIESTRQPVNGSTYHVTFAAGEARCSARKRIIHGIHRNNSTTRRDNCRLSREGEMRIYGAKVVNKTLLNPQIEVMEKNLIYSFNYSFK
ncbi:hypothetical protein M514_10417 [Trichuris suis]|uniref:Cystatin domain-containing protein n=1 Tax=Trichuris suis TaxID=68888 RepID=A0A085LUR0_9BILA|nr:hypothetical protein M513_10417 [Trichuris suis]KFD69294.1 hypothetical protein M514_10417 [Trichuris suis]